jgi:Cu2+-exporting ATPase
VHDELRVGVRESLAALSRLGVRVGLATGDPSGEGERLGRELRLGQVRSGCLPEDKSAWIRDMEAQGERVLFVGDGLNDGPALAEASVGLAAGDASGLARHAAHGVMLSARLDVLPRLLDLALRTRRTLRRNLVLAIGYNLAVLPFAVAGHLGPLAAALLMPASSSVVVLSAVLGTRVGSRR